MCVNFKVNINNLLKFRGKTNKMRVIHKQFLCYEIYNSS